MRLASCPRCGKPRPSFDGHTVSCQRCQLATQLTTVAAFLEKVETLWPDSEATLRSKRVLGLIEQHDEWLQDRGWYDTITAALDENWEGEDGFIYDAE